MEEQTSLCSFFRIRYNRLQSQDNPKSIAGLQLNSKCKLKLGLFVSFLALSASFEVLLASSIGKSAFPNDSVISDFFTSPLSKNHEHFTNGTVLGLVGFLLSLIVLVYFVNRLWSLNKLSYPQRYSTTFTDSGLFEFNGNPLYQVKNFYTAYRINPQSHTLAAFVMYENIPIYVGIPCEKHQENAVFSKFFDEEIERLKNKGMLPKGCGYDRFVIVPRHLGNNLNEAQVRTSHINYVASC